MVVCDGFVGNVILKFAEGLAESAMTLIKDQMTTHPFAKLGGLLMRGALREVKRKTDYAEYGGAPLLGVNGVCIICHGKSNKKAIYNAIRVAGQFVQNDTNRLIQEELPLAACIPMERFPKNPPRSISSFRHAHEIPYSYHQEPARTFARQSADQPRSRKDGGDVRQNGSPPGPALKQRHVAAKDEAASDPLAIAHAAKRALQNAEVKAEAIELEVVVADRHAGLHVLPIHGMFCSKGARH